MMFPPFHETVHGELGCVSRNSNCYIPSVLSDIVNSKRNCYTFRITCEKRVFDLNGLHAPSFSLWLVISDQLLLFSINAYHGDCLAEKLCLQRRDVFKLFVTVRVLCSRL